MSVALPLSLGHSFSRRVRDGAPVSGNSKFIDDVWTFDRRTFVPGQSSDLRWSNMTFEDGSALADLHNVKFFVTLKEYAYLRSSGQAAIPGVKRVKPVSVMTEVRHLMRFARWLFSEGKQSFAEATQRDLDRYAEWLGVSEKQNGQGRRRGFGVACALFPIQTLWRCREHVDGTIDVNPWNGRSVLRVLDYQRPDENQTAIIPDEVMQPLYKHALRLIQPDVVEPIIELLRQRASQTRRQVKAQRHEVFVFGDDDEMTYSGLGKLFDLDVNAVYSALFVIIAGLSGMRNSEARSICLDCVDVENDAAGHPKIYKIKGRTYKSAEEYVEDHIGGEDKSWVVIKEVYDAVKALERMAAADPLFDGQRLFPKFNSTTVVNDNLKRLLGRVRNDDGSAVVGPDGRPWNLTSSQFRRSLARWIVWQPFGIVAGKNLFGHARIATTQGYAASDLGWNKLVAQEESALLDEVMSDLAHDVANGAVAGIRGKELVELFGTAGDRRPDDVLFYLRHHKKELHIGPYSYCFFDPNRAACKRFAPAEQQNKPVTSFCSPDRCANACISRRHLPAWKAQANDLQEMLRTKGLNEAQKMALERERARIEAIIAPLTKGSPEVIQDVSQGV